MEQIWVLADPGSNQAATMNKRIIRDAVNFNVAAIHGPPVVGMCETVIQHYRPCAHLSAAQIVTLCR